jgi:hypothetical protein
MWWRGAEPGRMLRSHRRHPRFHTACAHGGHLLGALDFLKEDNAHPALKSVREVSRSFEFGFDT